MRGSTRYGWLTLPVLIAIAIGVLVATIVNRGASNAAGAVLVVVALLGLGYGLAHLLVTNVIVGGLFKRRRAADTTDEEWVDEVVHPEP